MIDHHGGMVMLNKIAEDSSGPQRPSNPLRPGCHPVFSWFRVGRLLNKDPPIKRKCHCRTRRAYCKNNLVFLLNQNIGQLSNRPLNARALVKVIKMKKEFHEIGA